MERKTMHSIKSERIPYSRIRMMFDKASALERQGRDIIHLEIGRPDFNTPPHIVEAAVDALRAGKHHYSESAGIPELRRAVSTRYEKDYELEYDPGTEVVVTNGVSEAIYVAVSALLNPGDQILIPDPRWINYDVNALMNFVDPVAYNLYEEDGFNPDPKEIEHLITPRTKMLLLSSPSNPTGSVIRKDVLQSLALLAEKHDLIVVSDEIYEKIIYPPAVHICFASLPDMAKRTVVLSGFSKFYSMTGWRLGYAVGPEKLMNAFLRFHLYVLTSVSTFAQWGALTALTSDQDPSIQMVAQFRKRRDFFTEAVSSIPGFTCYHPEGAFYLFPSIEKTGLDGLQMADLLLDKAGVATVGGECFGENGKRHIRLSYASSMESLERAAARIESVVSAL